MNDLRNDLKKLLSKIKILTGVDMASKYTTEELTELVDMLVGEVRRFKHIADPVKVLEEAIRRDANFYGLTPQKAHGYLASYWLSKPAGERNKLINPQAPKEESQGAPPEVAQKYLEEWKKSLDKIEERKPRTVAQAITRSDAPESLTQRLEFVTVVCPHCEGEGCDRCKGYGAVKHLKR